MNKKKNWCKWCDTHLIGKGNCPNIIFMGIKNKKDGDELIIRGKKLSLQWINNNILVFSKED